MTKSPEYVVWRSMKQRCYEPKQVSYPNYGGRGIKVCERWLNSFDAFLEDMGPKPGPAYQIDRKENDGDYTPENCRWVTKSQQDRNKSNNVWLTFQGETLCLADWAKRTLIPIETLCMRVKRGWSTEEALTLPQQKPGPSHLARRIEFKGEALTVAEWAGRLGVPPGLISNRLGRGWTVERALTEATTWRGRKRKAP